MYVCDYIVVKEGEGGSRSRTRSVPFEWKQVTVSRLEVNFVIKFYYFRLVGL